MSRGGAGAAPASGESAPNHGRSRGRRNVLVMGGLARLASLYQSPSPELKVVVANADSPLTARRIHSFDAIVVVPTNVSHQAARRVLDGVRRTGAVVRLAASPGVGAVRKAIEAAVRNAALRRCENSPETEPHGRAA